MDVLQPSGPSDQEKEDLAFSNPNEEGEEGEEEQEEDSNEEGTSERQQPGTAVPHDESVIEEHIELPIDNKLIDNTPALEVPDACTTAVESNPTSSPARGDAVAHEVTDEILPLQPEDGYATNTEEVEGNHHNGEVTAEESVITNSVEKKKKTKKKKKKLTKRVEKPSEHPTASALPRIGSHHGNSAVGGGPVHEPQMVARATSESRIIRPASRPSSPQKLLDGEIDISTYHPYHTVLVENAYVRPVVVTILIPEKLPGDKNTSSSDKKKLKKKSSKKSSKKDETSEESDCDNNGYDDTSADEDFSNGAKRRLMAGDRGGSSSVASSVDPNLLFALDIKHFRYLVVKVNDVVKSREAIYPVVLRDFRALQKELIQEYWTPAAGDYYRPNSLKWWARYIKKIVVVFDKPTGQLSALVDKKAIRRIVRKKMEHHQWMTASISSSQQQHRPAQEGSLIPTHSHTEATKPVSPSHEVDPFSSTYRSEHVIDKPMDPDSANELGESSNVELDQSYESTSLVDRPSAQNDDNVNLNATDDNGNPSPQEYFIAAVESDIDGYNSLDGSDDEVLGRDSNAVLESVTYSVTLPTVVPESSSSQQRSQQKQSSSHSHGGRSHQKKPKSSGSADSLPVIQQKTHSSGHGGAGRASTAAERVPTAAEVKMNKLLSKAYAPLIPPHTQEEIEEMFAPKKKRPMRKPKQSDSGISASGSIAEDQSFQLSDASVADSWQGTDIDNHLPLVGNSSPLLAPIQSSSSFSRPHHRPRSPFQEEIKVLKKSSEKLAANILIKARKAISSSEEFQNRKITQTEIKLLDSPFAKKIYREPQSTEAILKNLSIHS